MQSIQFDISLTYDMTKKFNHSLTFNGFMTIIADDKHNHPSHLCNTWSKIKIIRKLVFTAFSM